MKPVESRPSAEIERRRRDGGKRPAATPASDRLFAEQRPQIDDFDFGPRTAVVFDTSPKFDDTKLAR